MTYFDLDEDSNRKPWPALVRSEPETTPLLYDTDDHAEDMLVWVGLVLLAVAVFVILWACKAFRWLQ